MPFEHLIKDPVILILAIGSLVSWSLIVDRLLLLRRTHRDDLAFLNEDSESNSALIILKGEFNKHSDKERNHLLTIMDTALQLQKQKLESTLPLLGVIGSTAPYVGLLGTVIGIIQAFQAIQAANNMSPSVVAGGIATALVATAMGLAVAIPAVAAHHLFSASIGRRVSIWESEISEWMPKEVEHESIPIA